MKRPAAFVVLLAMLATGSAYAAGNPHGARDAGRNSTLERAAAAVVDGRRGNDQYRGNDRRDHVQRNPGNDDRGQGRAPRAHDRRDDDHRGNDHRGNDRHDNDRRDWNDNRRDHDRRDWNDNRRDHDRRDWNDDRRDHDRRNWDRDRNHNGRPDRWDHYRGDWNRHPNYWDNRRHDRADHARYRYNYGSYYRPSGYYHHVWHRGERLPRGWYGNSYVVYDWRPYRLYAPPYGYHWVRVGDDVLLTALATGVVLDVIYDIWY